MTSHDEKSLTHVHFCPTVPTLPLTFTLQRFRLREMGILILEVDWRKDEEQSIYHVHISNHTPWFWKGTSTVFHPSPMPWQLTSGDTSMPFLMEK